MLGFSLGNRWGRRLADQSENYENESCTIRYSLRFKNEEQLLRRNVKRFPGGLVVKANKLFCHLTLGSREIKKKETLVT